MKNNNINNDEIKKIINVIIHKIYYMNKYYKIKIYDDYKINYFANYYIMCLNNKSIMITLPNKNNKNIIIGSSIYIKNMSQYNINIYSECNCLINNLQSENNFILIRPKSIIKIILLNKDTYLVIKIQ